MNGINVSTNMEHELVKNPKSRIEGYLYRFLLPFLYTGICSRLVHSYRAVGITSPYIVEVPQDSSPI
jgi:hypothetical protein